MIVKPLIFELVRENDIYFPGEKGSRTQVETNLKKFIYLQPFGKRKTSKTNINNKDKTKSSPTCEKSSISNKLRNNCQIN
jgi:hypothetical protein